MSTTICGDLHGIDTKDVITATRKARTYSYKLYVSGGGTCRFKIKKYCPALLGSGGSAMWVTLESRSKVASGAMLSGEFTVPATVLSSSVSSEWTTLKFIFSRGALTTGLDYELFFEPV